MRRVLILLLMTLAMPIAALASTIDLTNKFGSITITDAGITSKGFQLKDFDGITAPGNHSLGSLSFTTGALLTGSVATGGTFSATGSTFIVMGRGNFGEPKGLIFKGTFVGPITWAETGTTKGKEFFTLSGTVTGMLYNGRTYTGTTTQEFFTVAAQLKKGIAHSGGGTTSFNSVPEPGTLGLLGTGLLGIAGMFRRKLVRP